VPPRGVVLGGGELVRVPREEPHGVRAPDREDDAQEGEDDGVARQEALRGRPGQDRRRRSGGGAGGRRTAVSATAFSSVEDRERPASARSPTTSKSSWAGPSGRGRTESRSGLDVGTRRPSSAAHLWEAAARDRIVTLAQMPRAFVRPTTGAVDSVKEPRRRGRSTRACRGARAPGRKSRSLAGRRPTRSGGTPGRRGRSPAPTPGARSPRP
jgi:hypothetical protein